MTSNAAQSSISTQPEQENAPLISGKIVIWSIVAIAVLGILFIGLFLWLAFTFPDRLEAIRDVVIMLFALVSCSAVVVLMMLLVAIIRLINMLEFEIKPILEKTGQTISMLQGTTSFVGNHVIKPTIETTSFIAGVRRGIQTLLGNPRKNLPK